MLVIYIIAIALAFDLSICGIVSALCIYTIARASGLSTCVYFFTCAFARTTEFIHVFVHFALVLIIGIVIFIIVGNIVIVQTGRSAARSTTGGAKRAHEAEGAGGACSLAQEAPCASGSSNGEWGCAYVGPSAPSRTRTRA